MWREDNGISVVLRIKSVAQFLRKCGELLWIGDEVLCVSYLHNEDDYVKRYYRSIETYFRLLIMIAG